MVVGIVACAAAPLSAIDIEVDFLEGKLEYRERQNEWRQLGIGDIVPADCLIRLSNRGFAEFSAGPKKVTLIRAGVYSSSELIGDSLGEDSFRQIIGSKFSALITGKLGSSHNTAAAVRGAAFDSDNFITWEDESANYLEDGLELMEIGDLIGAREAFKKGSLWESGTIQRECIFRHGIVEQMIGNPRAARGILTSFKPAEDDHFLGEYSIVMAAMYIESMEYEQANEILSAYLLTNPNDGDASQAAWLLLAYSLAGLEDEEGSRASLKKAIELGPKNEIGMAAAKMLK